MQAKVLFTITHNKLLLNDFGLMTVQKNYFTHFQFYFNTVTVHLSIVTSIHV